MIRKSIRSRHSTFDYVGIRRSDASSSLRGVPFARRRRKAGVPAVWQGWDNYTVIPRHTLRDYRMRIAPPTVE